VLHSAGGVVKALPQERLVGLGQGERLGMEVGD
jgi:hypothetical protein